MKYLAVAVLAMALCSCGSEPSSTPARITVEPGAIVLRQADSVRLVARAVDEDGATLDVALSFESADTTRVKVSSEGMVKSVGDSGLVNILVGAGGVEKNVPVTVVQVQKTLTLTPATDSIAQLGTVQLTATVLDPFGKVVTGVPVFFYSSSFLLSVSSTGLVTSQGAPGTGMITAYSANAQATATIVVVQVPAFIYVSQIPLIMGSGSSGLIEATVYDLTVTPMPNVPLTFTPADPSLVSISSSGIVTALGPVGNTLVTITADTLTASTTVTVVPGIAPVAMDSVAGNPTAAAVSPTGEVYVVTFGGTVERASLTNFTFNTVLTGMGNLRAVAFSPSGTEAYIAGDPMTGLRIIDVASNTVTGTVGPVNGQPRDIDVDSAGLVYLSTDAGIYVIDPVGKVILDNVDISFVLYIDLHPVLPLLYASELQLGRLRELSTSNLVITRTYQPGGNPVADLAVSDDGTTLYSADEGSGVVTFIELATGNPTYYPIGCTSRMLLRIHQSSELYVGCSTFGGVNILDTVTGTVVKGINVSVAGQMAQGRDGLSIVIPGSDGKILLLQ